MAFNCVRSPIPPQTLTRERLAKAQPQRRHTRALLRGRGDRSSGRPSKRWQGWTLTLVRCPVPAPTRSSKRFAVDGAKLGRQLERNRRARHRRVRGIGYLLRGCDSVAHGRTRAHLATQYAEGSVVACAGRCAGDAGDMAAAAKLLRTNSLRRIAIHAVSCGTPRLRGLWWVAFCYRYCFPSR